MGVKYDFGNGGYPKDPAAAAQLYDQAARQNHSVAQYNLALLYHAGKGIPKDDQAALYWFRQSANQNYRGSLYMMGVMYRNGWGVAKSDVEAIRWYRKAAAQNHGDALNNLGFMYENGYGVRRDRQSALRYYRRAAENDSTLGKQNLARLENILNSGRGNGNSGNGNQTSALQAHKLLPDYDTSLSARQAYDLARNYYFGRNGQQTNRYVAAQLYQQSAMAGFARAQYLLAVCYAIGQGVQKNFAEAMFWYRQAANQGLAGAQYGLGVMYRNGEGVPRNDIEAVRWYRLAAATSTPTTISVSCTKTALACRATSKPPLPTTAGRPPRVTARRKRTCAGWDGNRLAPWTAASSDAVHGRQSLPCTYCSAARALRR